MLPFELQLSLAADARRWEEKMVTWYQKEEEFQKRKQAMELDKLPLFPKTPILRRATATAERIFAKWNPD